MNCAKVSDRFQSSSSLESIAYHKLQRYAFEGPTIIYAQTRKMVEELHSFLTGFGITAGIYHAGRTDQERYDVHHAFVRDKIQV